VFFIDRRVSLEEPKALALLVGLATFHEPLFERLEVKSLLNGSIVVIGEFDIVGYVVFCEA
jgi:hypothetical protein